MNPTAPLPLLAFQKHFESLTDPRIQRRKKHSLENVLVIALCATLSGADGWEAMTAFGEYFKPWLSEWLSMPNGIPSPDTFRRVFCALDPEHFSSFFRSWALKLGREFKDTEVVFDGKAVKSAFLRARPTLPLYLMHAWSVEHGLVLAHQRIAGASGENQAMLEMIKLLNLNGATVTADANGCTKEATEALVACGAYFILALKGNRGPLFDCVKAQFERVQSYGFEQITSARVDGKTHSHGRDEKRTVAVIEVTPEHQLPLKSDKSTHEWTGIRCMVMVKRERTVNGKSRVQQHYYITNHAPDADLLAKKIRGHWSIENQLHWVLDVTFGEDQGRIRDLAGAENLAMLTRMSLSMLKRADFGKFSKSIKAKRLALSWRPDFFPKVFAAGFPAL